LISGNIVVFAESKDTATALAESKDTATALAESKDAATALAESKGTATASTKNGNMVNAPFGVAPMRIFQNGRGHSLLSSSDNAPARMSRSATAMLREQDTSDAPKGMFPSALVEPVISFDATGGESDTPTKPVIFGRKYDEMPVPSMDGHVFDGWHTKREGGARIMENSRVKTRVDTIYYAHWIPQNQYRKVRGLPILMYHWFYDKSAGERSQNGNWLDVGACREQMADLHENKYRFPSWNEVEAFVDRKMALPQNSVVITDDDGDDSFFSLAIPVIKQYDIDVTAFLITSAKGRATVDAYADEHIRYRSHSHNMHRAGAGGKGAFLSIGYDNAMEDLRTSIEELGGHAEVFCYPFGHYNTTTEKILKDAGFRLALTVEYNRTYPGANKSALPRVRISEGESLASYISRVK
jgi:peptidoglycan/xylan/chitin deacetylase (PgdA/CDA1 family)